MDGEELVDDNKVRAILAHLPHFTALIGRDRRYRWSNRIDPPLTPEQLLAMRVDDTVSEASYDALVGAIEKAFESGVAQTVEALGHGWGERGAYYETTVAPLPNADGVIDEVVLISNNVTDRVQALEELKASEERFRVVVEAFPETILIVDETLSVRYANHVGDLEDDEEAKARLAHVLTSSILDLTAPADREKAEASIRATLETGQPTSYTARGVPDDGEHLFRADVGPFVDDVDGKRQAIIVVRDETERLVAERRMQLAEERLNFITRTGQIDLWEYDRADDQTTTTRDDVGSPAALTELMGPLSAESQQALRGALGALQGDTDRFTLELSTDEGPHATTWLTKAAIVERDEAGDWTKLRGTSVDITASRKVHEEQLALREQLKQSQKLEAIGQLAGGVAHDFNNLLQVIIGHLTLALDDQEAGSAAALELEAAQSAASKAAQLTRQLLTYARKQPHRPEVVSLASVVASHLSMLERILPESVHVRSPASTVQVSIEADPGQIGQVLMNLCVNARDAMPDGGILTIEAERVHLGADDHGVGASGAGPYVVLRVLDTGTGLSPEALERAEEPFFTTKRTGEGSGLGLSVVAGIVSQHGGSLHLRNREPHGATVEVFLPVVDKAPTLQVRRADAKASAKAEISHRVLLAEDEEMVRNVLVRTLGRAGFDVLVATNGPEAVAIGRSADPPIDIAVIDAVMPGMSGREVCEALLKGNPSLPVVFASGYSDSVLGSAFLEEHEIELIPKPFEGRVLVEAMKRALER
jgi:two-component system cell cycle sensor histidine kinase/response regulator CckA